MALDKSTLKDDIVAMLNHMKTVPDQSAGIQDFATMLSDAIDKYIKTGEVKVTAAIGDITVSPDTHASVIAISITGDPAPASTTPGGIT